MKRDWYANLIWPRPREVKPEEGAVSLSLPMRLNVAGAAPWLGAAAGEAAAAINRTAARRLVSSAAGDGKSLLTLTTMDELPSGIRPVSKPEGYVLSLNATGVVLAGSDHRGLLHGAQTLVQLLRSDAPPARIVVRDWPAFPIRGVHMYVPPKEQMSFVWQFLDFMAEVKLNTLVLEIGGGMEYERHPEINRAWAKFCKDALTYDYDKDTDPYGSKGSEYKLNYWGRSPRRGPSALQSSRYFRKDSPHTELAGGTWLTKKELRQLKAECDRRQIEIIPEVQSLSHCYYLCCAHPEIAERANDPWPDTYCPSNPKSYELLFDVMDEVIDLFAPRIMHIGHDEAYTFRICPKCRKRSAHDIFAEDVTRIHDFLAARGIRTFLWGDKFMNITRPDGTRMGGVAKWTIDRGSGKKDFMPATYRAAERVPHDLLILDWYYASDPKSERNFHKHGFDVVYGNFNPFKKANIQERAKVPFVLGAEMSTWCEVSPYAFGHNGAFYDIFAGADMWWGGRHTDRERTSLRMAPWLTRAVECLTGQERWLVSGGKGKATPIDLTAAAQPLPASLAGRLRAPAGGGSRSAGRVFALSAKGSVMKGAVVLDSAHPRSSSIPVGRKAARLLVLQGATLEGVYHGPTWSFDRGPADVLRYQVKYADGKRATFSAFFGEDIGRVAGSWPASRADYCFRAVPVPAGPGHTLYAQEWVNPRPDVAIESLSITLGPDATKQGEALVAAISVVR